MLSTPELTYRRLEVLIKALPRESLVVQAVQGPLAEWSTGEHMLATIIDELRGWCYTYVSAHTPKGKSKPTRPKPIERPGMVKPKKVKMTRSEMQAKLRNTKWRDVVKPDRLGG